MICDTHPVSVPPVPGPAGEPSGSPEPGEHGNDPPAPEQPPKDGRKRLGTHLLFGFLMGSADLVPGVSGGTVALACGIYPRLIGAVRQATGVLISLIRGRPGEAVRRFRSLDWFLLAPLLAGIVLAVISLAATVAHFLETQPVRVAGLFLGLVMGSVIVAFGMLRRVRPGVVAVMVVTAVAFFLILGLIPTTSDPAATGAPVALWAYAASGAFAVCAMILPGISGSLMLVSIGMYDNVLGAVNNREVIPILLVLAGCIVGLALFSRLLFWLIEHHHDPVVAAMIGLMLGSVRILWPWPGGPLTSELGPPQGELAAPLLLAMAGMVLVLLVARLGAGGSQRISSSEA